MTTVTLGRDAETRSPVLLQQSVRDAGMYVIGQTRSGKTSFLLNLMLQDAEQEYGFCFLDPHGDAIDDLIARLPRSRKDDIVLLNVGDDAYPFGINFYEVRDPTNQKEVALRAEQAVDVFKKVWGDGEGQSWGPRLEDLLRVISHTLIANPGYTMAEIPRLLVDGAFRRRLAARVKSPVVRDFWRYEYDPETDREQREHRASTINKVRKFLVNPVICNIIGQSKTTIDFRWAMDHGKIVLVKLALADVGEEAVDLLGSIIVGLVLNAAYSRADTRERPRFHLYADEYQRFATPAFATLLAEAGKYGICTTTAHQDRQQLWSAGAQVATIKAGTLVVFHVNGRDAGELAQNFDRTPKLGPLIGQEPELVPAQDAIARLIRDGHKLPHVQALTREYLAPLVGQLDTQVAAQHAISWHGVQFPHHIHTGLPPPRYVRVSVFSDLGWYMYPLDELATLAELHVVWHSYPDDGQNQRGFARAQVYHEVLRHGIDALNSYLYKLMSGAVALGSDEHITATVEVLAQLRGYVGFAPQLALYDQGSRAPLLYEAYVAANRGEFGLPLETRRALAQIVGDALNDHEQMGGRGTFIATRFQYWSDEIRLLACMWSVGFKTVTMEEYLQASSSQREDLREHLDKCLRAYVEENRWRDNIRDNVIREACEEGDQLAQARAGFEYERLMSWVPPVLDLGRALCNEPILVATGQYTPRYQPQTHVEREHEIANELAHLPPRSAHVRILREDDRGRRTWAEHLIETAEMPVAGAVEQANRWIADIQQSVIAAGYCRDVKAVQEEIERRQGDEDQPDDLDELDNEDDGPSTSGDL